MIFISLGMEIVNMKQNPPPELTQLWSPHKIFE